MSSAILSLDILNRFLDVLPSVEPVHVGRSERHSGGATEVDDDTLVAGVRSLLHHGPEVEVVIASADSRHAAEDRPLGMLSRETSLVVDEPIYRDRAAVGETEHLSLKLESVYVLSVELNEHVGDCVEMRVEREHVRCEVKVSDSSRSDKVLHEFALLVEIDLETFLLAPADYPQGYVDRENNQHVRGVGVGEG